MCNNYNNVHLSIRPQDHVYLLNDVAVTLISLDTIVELLIFFICVVDCFVIIISCQTVSIMLSLLKLACQKYFLYLLWIVLIKLWLHSAHHGRSYCFTCWCYIL